MNSEIKFRPFDEFDEECKMDINMFNACVESGIFGNDDGIGYYATNSDISNFVVNFLDFDKDNFTVPIWATHVVWFNK